MDRNKCVIKIGLQRPIAVRVDDLQSVRGRNRQVVRCEADKGAWSVFSMSAARTGRA